MNNINNKYLNVFYKYIYEMNLMYFCDNNNFFSKIFLINLFFLINKEISLFNFLIAFHNNYFTITILYMKN